MSGRAFVLTQPRTGRVLAERLAVPRTFVGRALGLLPRSTLAAGEGMWIRPCNGIHMFGMRFAIDAVFLDRRLRVVRVCSGLKPWRIVPLVSGAHSVLELPAGSVAALGGLELGEQLTIEPAAAA